MSTGSSGKVTKLVLRLDLSHPAADLMSESPTQSVTVSPRLSSCESWEVNSDVSLSHSSTSSREARAMVLFGCQQCLMYVMVSGVNPRCPKCKSTALLDLLRDNGGSVTDDKHDKKPC